MYLRIISLILTTVAAVLRWFYKNVEIVETSSNYVVDTTVAVVANYFKYSFNVKQRAQNNGED